MEKGGGGDWEREGDTEVKLDSEPARRKHRNPTQITQIESPRGC